MTSEHDAANSRNGSERFGAQQVQLDAVPIASFRSDFPATLPQYVSLVPPPIPVDRLDVHSAREKFRPLKPYDHLSTPRPHNPVASLSMPIMGENAGRNTTLDESTFALPFEIESTDHSSMSSVADLLVGPRGLVPPYVEHEFASAAPRSAVSEEPSVNRDRFRRSTSDLDMFQRRSNEIRFLDNRWMT